MAARLHHPLRGLKNLAKTNRPPNVNQKRTFAFSVPLPPPPPPAAAARGRAPSLPLSALRSLAQHLVSSSKRLFSTQPVTGAAPLKHTHLPSDLASRIRVGRGAMPGFGGFHSSSAGRFGPGGLGRGPMGPGVRGGFSRGVGNVGLGTARGYASMARPLFDGVVGNTPLALRALANALEDQAENLKAPHRSLHHSSKPSSSKKQRSSAHPYLKPASKKTNTSTSAAVAAAVEESSSASDDHTLFFSPSPAQTLPTASSPSSTTTLFLPFCLNSTTHTFPPSHYPSLSHLASTHREAYQTHALRVERLIKAMEDKGVFLDGGVREEEVKDWEEEVLGVKVVFEGRSEEEVRVILGKQHQGGEGEWWFLDEQERTISQDASVGSSSESLIYPTIALPLPIAINPDSIFASASNSLYEDQVLEERAEWSASSSSPSLSEDASTSSSLSSSSLSSSSDGLGSSASFISEFEQDEDLDDADWLSEYSGGFGSGSATSSSMLVLMEEQARSVEEEEEMGTELFSSAYWSEMGGNGEELR